MSGGDTGTKTLSGVMGFRFSGSSVEYESNDSTMISFGGGEGEGEGEGEIHGADQTGDGQIDLSELLRIIQFFNSGGYHVCPLEDPPTEGGLCPGPA